MEKLEEVEALSTSYNERDEKDLDTIREETIIGLIIARENIEYILGNAQIEDSNIFGKLESLNAACTEMQEFMEDEAVKNNIKGDKVDRSETESPDVF